MRQSAEGSKNRFTILVPIHHAELFETLLPPAIHAAEKNNGNIILLSAVKVPFKVWVSMAKGVADDRLLMLAEEQKILKEAGYKCEIMVKITHSLTSAIKNIVESREVDLVIMGSKKKARYLFKSLIYRKLLGLNCPIMLAKDNVRAEFKNVIIIDDGLQNVIPMLEHALFLLVGENPKIYVAQTSNDQEKIKKLKNDIAIFKKEQQKFKPQIFLAPDVIKDNIMKIMVTDNKEDTCFFYSYTERKWLKHLFHTGKLIQTSHPVFLFKP